MMKYHYTIKIHSVVDYNELETIMNDYGKSGIRVTKVEFMGHSFEKGRQMMKHVLYLEEKIKK